MSSNQSRQLVDNLVGWIFRIFQILFTHSVLIPVMTIVYLVCTDQMTEIPSTAKGIEWFLLVQSWCITKFAPQPKGPAWFIEWMQHVAVSTIYKQVMLLLTIAIFFITGDILYSVAIATWYRLPSWRQWYAWQGAMAAWSDERAKMRMAIESTANHATASIDVRGQVDPKAINSKVESKEQPVSNTSPSQGQEPSSESAATVPQATRRSASVPAKPVGASEMELPADYKHDNFGDLFRRNVFGHSERFGVPAKLPHIHSNVVYRSLHPALEKLMAHFTHLKEESIQLFTTELSKQAIMIRCPSDMAARAVSDSLLDILAEEPISTDKVVSAVGTGRARERFLVAIQPGMQPGVAITYDPPAALQQSTVYDLIMQQKVAELRGHMGTGRDLGDALLEVPEPRTPPVEAASGVVTPLPRAIPEPSGADRSPSDTVPAMPDLGARAVAVAEGVQVQTGQAGGVTITLVDVS